MPLTLEEMGRALSVCFYPGTLATASLRVFEIRLRSILLRCGVQLIKYEDALRVDNHERVREGVIIVTVGETGSDDLPINHVSSLSGNVVVSIFDRACPAHAHADLQAKLNAVMADMAWHFAHVLIYLEPEGTLTVCNMNGAIVSCDDDDALVSVLIPKLAAPVVPPRTTDFETREGAFEPADSNYANGIRDIAASGVLWKKTGLMVSQTPVSALNFRNKFYRRLGVIYLDHRTGMSYGFLSRQLPISTLRPALTLAEAKARLGFCENEQDGLFAVNGDRYLHLGMGNESYVVTVPEISVLGTRSGCEKTRIDPRRDIVRYVLRHGCIVLETPKGAGVDCKPSYDTLVIVAHALANAIIGSVMARRDFRSPFFHRLKSKGLALAHWHGFLKSSDVPDAYPFHGQENPGVSCSTPQSAIYAMQGKLRLLESTGKASHRFRGDVHTEPHHGTNFTCGSLTALARWLLQK